VLDGRECAAARQDRERERDDGGERGDRSRSRVAGTRGANAGDAVICMVLTESSSGFTRVDLRTRLSAGRAEYEVLFRTYIR